MTETNSPETFAAVVAKLRRDVEKLHMELAVAAASDYGADLKLQEKDATIAELKEQLADAKRCADRYESELSDVATQCGHAKGQIAELKEALRKIASDKGTGCVIDSCPFANDDSVYCEYCTNSAGEVARAALEKTEGKGDDK